jgi:hypothetical protein
METQAQTKQLLKGIVEVDLKGIVLRPLLKRFIGDTEVDLKSIDQWVQIVRIHLL